MYGGSPFQSLGVPYERHSYIVTPHAPTSFDPHQWSDPLAFNPERYRSVPTSDQVDEAKIHQIGLARCPFDLTQFNVADGRKASVNNSGFGKCSASLMAKRCQSAITPGSHRSALASMPRRTAYNPVFSDFLRIVWNDRIAFSRLKLANPGRVPVGPSSVIDDTITFRRRA